MAYRSLHIGCSICVPQYQGLPNDSRREDRPLWWRIICRHEAGLIAAHEPPHNSIRTQYSPTQEAELRNKPSPFSPLPNHLELLRKHAALRNRPKSSRDRILPTFPLGSTKLAAPLSFIDWGRKLKPTKVTYIAQTL